MNSTTDAYAAGLIDGEGCIYIANSKGFYSIRLDIGMTVKAMTVLLRMQSKYGGKIRRTREATDRWAEAHCWSVFGSEAARLLECVQPFLRLKAEQARLCLRLEELRLSGWTDETRSRAETLRRRIQELNAKGPEVPAEPGWFAQLVAGEWVTPQRDLFSDLGYQPYSETWPRSGTTRNGTAYRLRPLAPLIAVIGSSLLPTPSATSYGSNRSASPGAVVRPSLDTMARTGMWPTPTANDWKNAGYQISNGKRYPTLPGAARLWPTPRASDGAGASSHGRTWSTTDRNLHTVMRELGETKDGGQLNPTWVEWLMGFPIGWTACEPSATP